MSTIRLSNIAVHRGRPPDDTLSRVLAWFMPPQGSRKAFSITNFDLTVPHGKTMVILGPSGCGKSTLLRVISGLEAPDAGTVFYDGWDAQGVNPGERRIGMVFQNYALYPNLNARQNITSYFFFRRRTPENLRLADEKFRRTSELLDVDIEYLIDRMPANLSGGEQQRVALGRCITRDPALFLLDEPFSNLDAKLRVRYRLHLKWLLREFDITTIYVTHDQQEAALLGDLISIMKMENHGDWNSGSLEQTGTLQELYERPATSFVADFLNLHGDIHPISFLDGEALVPGLERIRVGVRPEDVEVRTKAGKGWLPGVLEQVTLDPVQQTMLLILQVNGHSVAAKVAPDPALVKGAKVWVRFEKYHVFDRRSDRRQHGPRAGQPAAPAQPPARSSGQAGA